MKWVLWTEFPAAGPVNNKHKRRKGPMHVQQGWSTVLHKTSLHRAEAKLSTTSVPRMQD